MRTRARTEQSSTKVPSGKRPVEIGAEALLRSVLALSGCPAVVMLANFVPAKNYWKMQDLYSPVADFYGVPIASLRDFAFPEVEMLNDAKKVRQFWHPISPHPSSNTHIFVADLVFVLIYKEWCHWCQWWDLSAGLADSRVPVALMSPSSDSQAKSANRSPLATIIVPPLPLATLAPSDDLALLLPHVPRTSYSALDPDEADFEMSRAGWIWTNESGKPGWVAHGSQTLNFSGSFKSTAARNATVARRKHAAVIARDAEHELQLRIELGPSHEHPFLSIGYLKSWDWGGKLLIWLDAGGIEKEIEALDSKSHVSLEETQIIAASTLCHIQDHARNYTLHLGLSNKAYTGKERKFKLIYVNSY